MSFTRLEPSGVNNTATFTFANANVTGNLNVGGTTNVSGNLTANYFFGNGSLLSGMTLCYTNADVANYLPTYTGNLKAGNANLGDAVTANSVTANYFYGNIVGNVVANSSVTAGTVTASSQPNITSVGSLTSLTVGGLITATNTGIRLSNIQDSTGTVTLVTKYNTNSGDVGITGNLTVGTGGSGNVFANNATLTGLTVSNSTGIVNFSNTANVTLGSLSNIHILGGAVDQALLTSGNGSLYWDSISLVSKGNSNIAVTANSNINMTVGGVANVLTVSSSGITVPGTISGNILRSTNSAGNEGGEIQLALAAANTTLTTSVTVDIYQNKLRFFETGGNNRGAYIDLSVANASIGSNLLSSGGTPGGSNTQLQFNDTGVFGGSSLLTFDKTSGRVTLPDTIIGTANSLGLTSINGHLIGSDANVTIKPGSISNIFLQTWVGSSWTNMITLYGNSVTLGGNVTTSNLSIKKFNETVVTTANTSTSISPDVSLGSIFNYTANNNFTFSGLTNATAGSSATVIITQDVTGSRLLTSTMKFAGGLKTLSTTAGAVDIISVFYDGTTYYASLSKGFA